MAGGRRQSRPKTQGKGCLKYNAAHMTSGGRPSKRSDAEVRAATTLFEAIVEIAEDAIVAVDSSQHIVLYNRGAEETFGYVQREVIGKPLTLLLPRWSSSSNSSAVMGQRHEVRGRRKDGR